MALFKFVDYNNYSKTWINTKTSGNHFAHDYLEKPAMVAKLPDLKSLSVLVLGCGSGEELSEIIKLKPSKIVAVDSSKELIETAKFSYEQIEFLVSKIEDLEFENQAFDYIFSSLTFHYIQDWQLLFQNQYNWLTPGGKVLFSTHHPIKWGAMATKNTEFNEFILGYKKHKKDASKYQIFGDYLSFQKINYKLFNKLDITYYNRSISQMFREITTSSLQIIDFLEPKPTPESKTIKPDFYEVYSKIPLFLIFEILKPKI